MSQLLTAAEATPLLNEAQHKYVRDVMMPNLDQVSQATHAKKLEHAVKENKKNSKGAAAKGAKKKGKKKKAVKAPTDGAAHDATHAAEHGTSDAAVAAHHKHVPKDHAAADAQHHVGHEQAADAAHDDPAAAPAHVEKKKKGGKKKLKKGHNKVAGMHDQAAATA